LNAPSTPTRTIKTAWRKGGFVPRAAVPPLETCGREWGKSLVLGWLIRGSVVPLQLALDSCPTGGRKSCLAQPNFAYMPCAQKARSRWRRDTHWTDRWDSRNGLLPTALADGSWHTGRHYVSYRTSKDLAQMSSWDYTVQWEAGMSRRLDLTGMRVLVQRWSASTLAVSHRTGQARDAANQTRHVGPSLCSRDCGQPSVT
jgi:hypothetical protein